MARRNIGNRRRPLSVCQRHLTIKGRLLVMRLNILMTQRRWHIQRPQMRSVGHTLSLPTEQRQGGSDELLYLGRRWESLARQRLHALYSRVLLRAKCTRCDQELFAVIFKRL